MTRKEASFYLANMDRKYMEKGMSEALDMAIQALEQNESAEKWYKLFVEKLSQEPNTDMVSDEIKILQKRSYLEGFHEALKTLVKQEPKSPCDVCKHNPPSSTDGKPCTMCPAERGAK